MLHPKRALELVLGRDRLFASFGVAAIVGLAWAYLVRISGGIDSGGMAMTDAIAMPQARGVDVADFGITFVMWF